MAELAAAAGIVISLEDQEIDVHMMADYIADLPQQVKPAALRLLQYVERTQMRSLSHLQAFMYTETKQFLRIDTNSKRNLELIQSIRGEIRRGRFYGCSMKQLQQWADEN